MSIKWLIAVMKNKYLIILGASIGIVAAIFAYSRYPLGQQIGGEELNTFAQCLAEKNITMYGADWCSHCQNEKKTFGSSFRFVKYVECPALPQKCLAAGINGYPTWMFSDGKKLEGEQGLEKLSQESGCVLPDFLRSLE